MELTWKGLKEREFWEEKDILLPNYDAEKLAEYTVQDPRWVHFGIGNIFRLFIGGIADQLVSAGELDRGIICAETFDRDIVDKIYKPHDNLSLSVYLKNDGSREYRVIGSLSEAVKACPEDSRDWERMKNIFRSPGLQMISFTITEKGYALTDVQGRLLPIVEKDLLKGPNEARSAMAIVTGLLFERFQSGGFPITLVSMDNCSQNGEKLRNAVLTVAKEWRKNQFVSDGFIDYISDEDKVSFPWTMIDKITPRPRQDIAEELKSMGIDDMEILVTEGNTYIAPYANGEEPQYLVIEDRFPGGRPLLEKAGVFMVDRDTVNKSERMKVTVCLNPIHTAVCTYGCMLNYELFADAIQDPELNLLARRVGEKEGMDVVPDSGILSPEKFLQEVLEVRFPNPYLGDTTQRIAVDISQIVGIRFGEVIKAYVEKYGSAKELIGIPLAIAGWLRYLLAVDDEGNAFELAPDPMASELQVMLSTIQFGHPESFTGQLTPILSNEHLFGSNLYNAGIGGRIEEMFRRQLTGPGAVRQTLKEYLA